MAGLKRDAARGHEIKFFRLAVFPGKSGIQNPPQYCRANAPGYERTPLSSARRLIFRITRLILDIADHAPGAMPDFPCRIAGTVADGLDRVARAVPDFAGHIARGVADDSAGLFDFSACAQ
jgi:hypothetical protein